MSALYASSSELEDLVTKPTDLIEATRGTPTGARLIRYIGGGGMSAVFLAELDPSARSDDFSPAAPRRLAIKFMKPDTERELARANIDPLAIFVKEAVALGRVMERKPPTEFVVGFYGSGRTPVGVGGRAARPLPWLAIEYVDGGIAGTSLTDRVNRSHHGVDPIRALRLIRGIVEGVRVLHGEGIIHRDLKPDNVLIAGPIDDETPKLADCGIARIEGMPGMTIAAMTPEYAGPEQGLAIQGQANPLVGPWTDVHALAAVVWFVLAREPWCQSNVDQAWHAGQRRSLRTATHLHPAYVLDTSLLSQLDAVLARGAAHRLPPQAWAKPGAELQQAMSKARYPLMLNGATERFADVDSFAQALIPIFERVVALWTSRAAKENVAATVFRPTQMLVSPNLADLPASFAQVHEVPRPSVGGTASKLSDMPVVEPGGVVFQPDGKVLARFGDRLVYFVSGEPHKVGVPEPLRDSVRASRWLVRGPGGGFALVGSQHIILIRGGRLSSMALPTRAAGGEVGEIQAVIGDAHTFGVVTAETDDSNGGPELWRSTDGQSWSSPTLLPLGGDGHALAEGPYGLLVVGARRGVKARALFVGLDEQTTVFTTGVNDKPPLSVAVSSAGRECWAAGSGIVLRFDKGSVTLEKLNSTAPALAMALDVVGVPWLVTAREVFRRHIEGNEGVWNSYYRRTDTQPALVAIGFTPDGAAVMDENGGMVEIVPQDIDTWRRRTTTQP